jgi:hypothetical protein
VIGDFDGDGALEVMIPVGWDIDGFNVDGTRMGYRLSTLYSIAGTPAVGDLDQDGQLEACIGGSWVTDPTRGYVYVWELGQPATGANVDWPIWRARSVRDGFRSSSPPSLQATPDSLVVLRDADDPGRVVQRSLQVWNGGTGEMQWTAEASDKNVSVDPRQGTATSVLETIAVDIDVHRLRVGTHDLGEISLAGSASGYAVQGSPKTIPVTVHVVEDLQRTILPLVMSKAR